MVKTITKVAAVAALLFSAQIVRAQSTPDQVVKACYASLCGEPDTKRDWAKFRSLFLTDGRMVINQTAADGTIKVVTLSIEDYIKRFELNLGPKGFYEQETWREAVQNGNYYTAWSGYQWGHKAEGPYQQYGINIYCLVKTQEGWKIESIRWSPSQTPSKPSDLEKLK